MPPTIRKEKNVKPSPEVLAAFYQRWLKGESLRSICRNTQYPFKSVFFWFSKEYGNQATNPSSNSLVRSIIKDYKNNPEVVEWAINNANKVRDNQHLFLSKTTLNHHSRKTTYDSVFICQVLEKQAQTDDEPEYRWEFLRLPFYLLAGETTQRLILKAYLNRYRYQLGTLEVVANIRSSKRFYGKLASKSYSYRLHIGRVRRLFFE